MGTRKVARKEVAISFTATWSNLRSENDAVARIMDKSSCNRVNWFFFEILYQSVFSALDGVNKFFKEAGDERACYVGLAHDCLLRLHCYGEESHIHKWSRINVIAYGPSAEMRMVERAVIYHFKTINNDEWPVLTNYLPGGEGISPSSTDYIFLYIASGELDMDMLWNGRSQMGRMDEQRFRDCDCNLCKQHKANKRC